MLVTINFTPQTEEDFDLLKTILDNMRAKPPASTTITTDDPKAATAALLAEAKAAKTRAPRAARTAKDEILASAQEFVESVTLQDPVVKQISVEQSNLESVTLQDPVVKQVSVEQSNPEPASSSDDIFADLLGDPKPAQEPTVDELTYEDLVNKLKAHIRNLVTPSVGIQIMQDIFRRYKVKSINDLSVPQLREIYSKLTEG